jgi:DNA-binding MurR/RpiR family transcriptional regulator
MNIENHNERANIVQIIRRQYNELNGTNRRIADFILQNLEMATFSSLLEISKKIGVSDASCVRFAKEIGYNGYQQLREALIDYIGKILYPSQKSSFLHAQSQHPSIELIMKKDIEYITKTMSKINDKDFNLLLDFIIDARKIYCVGWGYSSFLSEYLSYTLSYFSYDTVSVTRERRPMVQQLIPAREDDLIIVFDLLLYSAEVIEAIEYARGKNKEIKIVTITNDPMAYIVQFSNLSFFCDMSGHEFRLNSLSAPICFINAIIEQVVEKNSKVALEAVNEYQEVVLSSPLHFSRFDTQLYEFKGKEVNKKKRRNRLT